MIMVKPIRLDLGQPREIFGNPVPLGLIGLAVGCVALVPSAFGYGLTPTGLKTAAVFALLFGAGCQLLAGVMCFANKNVLSGTVFTAFAFLWLVNAWAFDALSRGIVPDHAVGLATEIVLIVIFLALTYAFGFFSKLLFLFLLDIDLLFAARIIKSVTGTQALNIPIGVLTVVLAVIALWLAFGALINPVVGKDLLPLGGPLFQAPQADSFDWKVRRSLFDVLYARWREHAFDELPYDELEAEMRERVGEQRILPDLHYLQEFGYVKLSTAEAGQGVASARINAAGIDLYEQLVLRKYG
jgi:succinate-acetate transporter protein